MRIKTFELGISEIVPTGEFQNARPHMNITWEIETNDVPELEMDDLFIKAQKELESRFNAWLPSIINKAVNNQHVKEDAAANKVTPSTCTIHNQPYNLSGVSKKTGKTWAAHKLEDGTMCWKKNY